MLQCKNNASHFDGHAKASFCKAFVVWPLYSTKIGYVATQNIFHGKDVE